MKSVKYIVLFLVIGLFLVRCESKKVSFDYDKAQKIIEKEITGLKKIDDDTLVDVYNLDLSVMDKHVFKQNTDGDFYAIIKTKDVDSIKDNMNDYFDKVQKFNKNYSQKRIEILDNRLEKEIDDYLIYIVSENADEIYDEIIKNM